MGKSEAEAFRDDLTRRCCAHELASTARGTARTAAHFSGVFQSDLAPRIPRG